MAIRPLNWGRATNSNSFPVWKSPPTRNSKKNDGVSACCARGVDLVLWSKHIQPILWVPFKFHVLWKQKTQTETKKIGFMIKRHRCGRPFIFKRRSIVVFVQTSYSGSLPFVLFWVLSRHYLFRIWLNTCRPAPKTSRNFWPSPKLTCVTQLIST